MHSSRKSIRGDIWKTEQETECWADCDDNSIVSNKGGDLQFSNAGRKNGHSKLGSALIYLAASLLHHGLGHITKSLITDMIRKESGIKYSHSSRTHDCVICTVSNHRQTPYVGNSITKRKTVTVHADRSSPVEITLYGGGKYFLAITTGEER